MDSTTEQAVSEREQFLRDIICTAMEGGIGYWAVRYRKSERTPEHEYVRAFIAPDGHPGSQFVLDAAAIERGIERIVSNRVWIDRHQRALIEEASRHSDASDIDASDADAIVQAAMFNEIVYG